MDISALPASDATLVDANIIIYYLGGLSLECRDFFHRVARREVKAHVTTTIIAEVLHRRMMAEAVAKGLISPGQPVKKLKANPTIIPQSKSCCACRFAFIKSPVATSSPATRYAGRTGYSSTTQSISPVPTV